MPFPAMGFEESLGFALEDTWGTATTPLTHQLRVNVNGIRRVQTTEPLGTIFGLSRWYFGVSGAVPRESTPPQLVEGSITFPFDFIEATYFVYNLFNTPGLAAADGYLFSANTNLSGGGVPAGVNEHKLDVILQPDDMPQSFTLVRFNGQNQHIFTGCHVRALEINQPEDGPATMTVEFLGRAMTTGGSEAEPGFSSSPTPRIYHSRVGLGAVGAARGALTYPNYTGINSWTIRYERAFTNPSETNSTALGTLGSNVGREPIPNDFVNCQLTLNKMWETDFWTTLWTAIGAGGYQCVELQIEHDIKAGTGAEDFYGFVWRLPAARFLGEYPTHGGGVGPVPETIRMEGAVFDAGAGPVQEQLATAFFYNADTTLVED